MKPTRASGPYVICAPAVRVYFYLQEVSCWPVVVVRAAEAFPSCPFLAEVRDRSLVDVLTQLNCLPGGARGCSPIYRDEGGAGGVCVFERDRFSISGSSSQRRSRMVGAW